MNPVRAKFNQMHRDFEANVTKIYMRRDLLTAMDLVFHSALQFYFKGDLVQRGWVEGLVVGDTRCGKSESITRMVRHYRVGEIVTGENATFAGLIGGMQQTQKTWSITWGKYPLNDRRALVIDELSGLPQEAIARMSGVRSSGVAEIIKIQTERTLARVRALWLSNPRGKRPIAAFNSGIEAIMDLIGQPEDVARFDFAMTVATGEVPLEVYNRMEQERVEQRYHSDICNRLLYWAWSRKPNQIVFSRETEQACMTAATKLSKKYVPPLVEGAEQRIKIARLAVAAAARVFSTDETREHVIVKPEHVEFVEQFLDEIYSKPSMAFDVHSRTKIADKEIADEHEVQERFEKLPPDVRSLLGDSQAFTVLDIGDYIGGTREQAQELASFLVRKRCIRKGKFGYYKTPAFIQFLRHFRPGRGREPGSDDHTPF